MKNSDRPIAVGALIAFAVWLFIVLPLLYLPSEGNVAQPLGVKADKILDSLAVATTALATIAIAWFTLSLRRSTDQLWLASKQALETTERAFVFIEGFNYELTTAPDTKVAKEDLPDRYKTDSGLYITRFAVQPKWKNGGNTPTRNLTICADWRGPLGPLPPEYVYRNPPVPFFLPPRATEASSFIEMPGGQALIDWSYFPVGPDPMMFIWGRAEYSDVFGKYHFIEWCYQVRFERHDGKKLRASFIQWGEYNRSDEG